MYTSLVLVALTGTLAATSANADVTWQTDYSQARTMGQADKKPLAVFIGSGANGYEKVCREGSLNADLLKMLGENYVCVYVDTSSPTGQKLASDFAISGGKGLVISDRTGAMQAFSHAGDLSTSDLSQWVKHFADPKVVVNTTLTNTSSRVSMYPPSGSTSIGSSGYVMYGSYPGSYMSGGYGSGSMVMGGGCPGGNCFRR